MVDWAGNWKAENNYNELPKEKWCDCDYVADWIKKLDYNVKTSVENLVKAILICYNDYLVGYDVDFYSDIKVSENGNMISIEDVSCYVEEHGGLKEFDCYC